MSTKKKVAKKSVRKKTLLQKVGATASHIKDDIVAGKDHLVEFAGEAIDSIKEGVKHLVQKKKPKKAAKKKSVKRAGIKKTGKRSAPKKAIKKTVKKGSVKK